MWRQAVTPPVGNPHQPVNNDIIINSPEQGTSRSYTLDRLSRQRSDLFAQVV
jgi:hypothetical protein